jgi:hypothetical protein
MGYKVTEGELTHTREMQKNPENARKIAVGSENKDEAIHCYVVATDWYDGRTGEYLDTTHAQTCEWQRGGSRSGGGRGDGGYEEEKPRGGADSPGGGCMSCYDPPEVPEPDFKIVNTISFRQYPCLSSSVNNAIDEDFSNEIQKMILDIFGESEDFNIEIEAEDLEDDKLDGIAFHAGGDPSKGYSTFTIVINTQLENASREYIFSTIYHEFLHVYMSYLNFPTIRPDDKADHEEMASKYLGMLSNVLIDQFGIKKSHAEALAWGGLGETDAFNKLYETEKNYIGLINKDYKDGKKGSKCN